MQKIFGVVAGLIVVAGLLFYFLVYNKPHKSVDHPDFTLPAATLIAEFDQDEETANRKYLDKVIEVRGPVNEILLNENKSIVMLGGTGFFSSVSCTFQPEADSELQNVKKGDTVTVRGICTGRLLDVILVDCKIVNDD